MTSAAGRVVMIMNHGQCRCANKVVPTQHPNRYADNDQCMEDNDVHVWGLYGSSTEIASADKYTGRRKTDFCICLKCVVP